MSFSGFSTYLFNTLVWNFAPLDLFQLGTTWAAVAPPAMAARLILRICRVFHENIQGTQACSDCSMPPDNTYELRPRFKVSTRTSASEAPAAEAVHV